MLIILALSLVATIVMFLKWRDAESVIRRREQWTCMQCHRCTIPDWLSEQKTKVKARKVSKR